LSGAPPRRYRHSLQHVIVNDTDTLLVHGGSSDTEKFSLLRDVWTVGLHPALTCTRGLHAAHRGCSRGRDGGRACVQFHIADRVWSQLDVGSSDSLQRRADHCPVRRS
jgi:hypothetical protein